MGAVESDHDRAKRYEAALLMIWRASAGKGGALNRAARDISAVALGLRLPGTHYPGTDAIAPPREDAGPASTNLLSPPVRRAPPGS